MKLADFPVCKIHMLLYMTGWFMSQAVVQITVQFYAYDINTDNWS